MKSSSKFESIGKLVTRLSCVETVFVLNIYLKTNSMIFVSNVRPNHMLDSYMNPNQNHRISTFLNHLKYQYLI